MDTSTRLKLGFAALMILSGIGVASYPVISNMVAQRHASTAIQNYDETVQSMDTEKLDAAKEAARRYNQQLGNRHQLRGPDRRGGKPWLHYHPEN